MQWSMVSLQWTAISGILAIELIFTILLLLPFINPRVWHAFFNSKMVQQIMHWKYTKAILHIGAAGLVLFLGDAIRAMCVYAQAKDDQAAAPVMSTADKDALINMRMYQAERNFFIVAFTLFFGFLIRRLISLICLEAELQAQAEGKVLVVESAKPPRSEAKKALDKLTKDE